MVDVVVLQSCYCYEMIRYDTQQAGDKQLIRLVAYNTTELKSVRITTRTAAIIVVDPSLLRVLC